MRHKVQNGDSYILADQTDQFSFHQTRHDKTGRSCCERFALSACMLGFVFLLGSVVSVFLARPLVTSLIEENLMLKEGGRYFQGWKDPPVNPIMEVFFFNLTNVDEVLAGTGRPRVDKIGPYVYTQEIHKVETTFSENFDRVTFSDNKTYFFSPNLSNGSESDLIMMPNLPLFGVFRKLADQSALAKTIFETILGSYGSGRDKEPFLILTVKEFLWGYPSLLISMDHMNKCITARASVDLFEFKENDDITDEEEDWDWGDDDNWDKEEEEEEKEEEDNCSIRKDNMKLFGLFIGMNQTVLNQRTLMTGLGNISNKGLVTEFEGTPDWSEERCNVVKGRDPGTLTTRVERDEELQLYFTSMCRPLYFRYIKTVDYSGLETLRFSPREDSFHNPVYQPENSCYCHSHPRHCLPSGVFDMGIGCKVGSPVYMSWPHFLHGDPRLRAGVHGIGPPDRDKHSFYLDILPEWGTVLAAHAAFQFNVLVEPNGFSWFSNVSRKVLLPFMMLEEGVPGPTKEVREGVELLVGLVDTVKGLIILGGFALGFLFMMPELVLWVRSCCRDGL